MDEHPIQGLMTTAMENLKDMIEVNTIIGDPVESPDGTVIIPVSKLGFGFAAGGSEFTSGDQGDSSGGESLPFGGGSGGGVSITPIAFLIISQKGMKMIHLDESTHIYEKMMDVAPKAVDKIQQLLKESGLQEKIKQQSKSKNDDEAKKQEKDKKRQGKQDRKQNDQQSDEEEDGLQYDI
ncbi:sporulation protein YtfJ [Lentibacillus cibarius]|uniref:Sporulation protein YtfJ n=1 Tax=Lentibacillus cibarius TaxID=2583219 RepID=A0A549YM55_9BACI|nr:GerW family sporulation protein [Lentibacillus cibarius]TRM12959.1 sporulation protein YtfJ [Lentibacillus cibarius]